MTLLLAGIPWESSRRVIQDVQNRRIRPVDDERLAMQGPVKHQIQHAVELQRNDILSRTRADGMGDPRHETGVRLVATAVGDSSRNGRREFRRSVSVGVMRDTEDIVLVILVILTGLVR